MSCFHCTRPIHLFCPVPCSNLLVSWAVSTFSPVGLLSSNGVSMHACVYLGVYMGIVWNELIRGYANVVHTSSSFSTHACTHAHILIPFEDHELMGLKVDIAVSWCFEPSQPHWDYIRANSAATRTQDWQ